MSPQTVTLNSSFIAQIPNYIYQRIFSHWRTRKPYFIVFVELLFGDKWKRVLLSTSFGHSVFIYHHYFFFSKRCVPQWSTLLVKNISSSDGLFTWREEDPRRRIFLAPYVFSIQFTCKKLYMSLSLEIGSS